MLHISTFSLYDKYCDDILWKVRTNMWFFKEIVVIFGVLKMIKLWVILYIVKFYACTNISLNHWQRFLL